MIGHQLLGKRAALSLEHASDIKSDERGKHTHQSETDGSYPLDVSRERVKQAPAGVDGCGDDAESCEDPKETNGCVHGCYFTCSSDLS
jgi:hypothetical protein